MIKPAAILVVDDQRDAREMLSEYLMFHGFAVHQARDGVEALDVACRHHPTIVLMDLMMPRMDGWEATRRLKADARTKDITIFAVSAHALTDEQHRARQAGCDGFIAKPYDLGRLTAVVGAVLNGEAPTSALMQSGFAGSGT